MELGQQDSTCSLFKISWDTDVFRLVELYFRGGLEWYTNQWWQLGGLQVTVLTSAVMLWIERDPLWSLFRLPRDRVFLSHLSYTWEMVLKWWAAQWWHWGKRLHGDCWDLLRQNSSHYYSNTQEIVLKWEAAQLWHCKRAPETEPFQLAELCWRGGWSVVPYGKRLCIVTVQVSWDRNHWVGRIILGRWSWNGRLLSGDPGGGRDSTWSLFRSPRTELFELVELY